MALMDFFDKEKREEKRQREDEAFKKRVGAFGELVGALASVVEEHLPTSVVAENGVTVVYKSGRHPVAETNEQIRQILKTNRLVDFEPLQEALGITILNVQRGDPPPKPSSERISDGWDG